MNCIGGSLIFKKLFLSNTSRSQFPLFPLPQSLHSIHSSSVSLQKRAALAALVICHNKLEKD